MAAQTTSEETKENFFLFLNHQYPERRTVAKQWMHNIGTGHTLKSFPFRSNSTVCKDHLETTCFTEDNVNKFLGLPQKKRLHSNAIPTEDWN